MSTLKTGKVKTTTIADELDTESTAVTNVINGSAKAWVNFNGTGTVAIRESFNVTSITDNSTGVYTVNFTNAMPDVNYAVTGSSRETASGNRNFQPLPDVTNTVSAVGISTIIGSTGGVADSQYIHVAVFR